MEYRRLGKSGLQVSEFSLGSWVTFAKQVDTGDAKSLMTAAYDAGVNFFRQCRRVRIGRLRGSDGRGAKRTSAGPVTAI